jgi:hypothetical protein
MLCNLSDMTERSSQLAGLHIPQATEKAVEQQLQVAPT